MNIEKVMKRTHRKSTSKGAMNYKTTANYPSAYSNCTKITWLNEDEMSQCSNDFKMSSETWVTTKSVKCHPGIVKNDNIVIRNHNTVSQGSNFSTNLSSNVADKENSK